MDMDGSAMKLWLPKWLRMTDAELESADRRLFLRGLTLTSAGLVVGVPIISVPKPMPQSQVTWSNGTITYFVIDNLGRQCAMAGVPATTVYKSVEELFAAMPKHGGGHAVSIVVRPS